jgi:hypothetical protein
MQPMNARNADAPPRSRWSGRRASIATLAVAAASLALLAGCGGSSAAKVAQVDSMATTTTGTGASGRSKRDALVAFSACMREHGVPKFPDPQVSGNGMSLSIGHETADAPHFKAAQRVCQRLLPNGGVTPPQEQARHLRDGLAFARCMREHGVGRFPDPKVAADGGIEWDFGPETGVDPNSPQFKSAQQACRNLFLGEPPPPTGGGGRP